MSADMFPQAFIDLMTEAKYFLVNSMGELDGPFDSSVEADNRRLTLSYPNEWAIRRLVEPR